MDRKRFITLAPGQLAGGRRALEEDPATKFRTFLLPVSDFRRLQDLLQRPVRALQPHRQGTLTKGEGSYGKA